jgi:tetratricopeptide (TPR) repeat protein
LFPAVINSVPSNAEVYYGTDKVGNTPYTGLLALGPNKIKVVKDGFFAETIDINMTMNSVYQTTVTLKTSKIGELINDAKEKLRHEQNEDAISLLIDALKYGGSQQEKAEVYFILGDTYLKQKDYEKAKSYFEKAQNNKKFIDRATLGLVKAYHGLGNTNQALTSIVGVLAKMDNKTPTGIRTEANEVFKKISPIKSVIYIHSEPAGADVFINDKKINQATPLILSDLALGNYRIQIEKPGFEKFNTKQNLKMSEFVVIKVKLNPEPL